MITRIYKTETECARCWISEDFENIPADLVLGQSDFFVSWTFYGLDDAGEYAPVDVPMWGTFFMPKTSLDADWLADNAESVASLGFTLIYRDGDFWGLGIDGAGYDFYEAHWLPLYRLRGFRWHDGAA